MAFFTKPLLSIAFCVALASCSGSDKQPNRAPVAEALTKSIDVDASPAQYNLLQGAADVDFQTITVESTTLTEDASGCNGGAPSASITGLTVNGSSATMDPSSYVGKLYEGDTKKLYVCYKLSDGQVTTDQSLTITIVGKGAPEVAVTGVTVDTDAFDVRVSGTREIMSTVAPADATDTSLTYASSDDTVASVSDTGVVTGVKVGLATITVTSKANATASATVAVTVKAEPISVASITLPGESVLIGRAVTLEATVMPSNADDKSLTWASDDETIATVDANGVVTSVKVGEVNITATSVSNTNINATARVVVEARPTQLPPQTSDALITSFEDGDLANGPNDVNGNPLAATTVVTNPANGLTDGTKALNLPLPTGPGTGFLRGVSVDISAYLAQIVTGGSFKLDSYFEEVAKGGYGNVSLIFSDLDDITESGGPRLYQFDANFNSQGGKQVTLSWSFDAENSNAGTQDPWRNQLPPVTFLKLVEGKFDLTVELVANKADDTEGTLIWDNFRIDNGGSTASLFSTSFETGELQPTLDAGAIGKLVSVGPAAIKDGDMLLEITADATVSYTEGFRLKFKTIKDKILEENQLEMDVYYDGTKGIYGEFKLAYEGNGLPFLDFEPTSGTQVFQNTPMVKTTLSFDFAQKNDMAGQNNDSLAKLIADDTGEAEIRFIVNKAADTIGVIYVDNLRITKK